MVNNPQPEVAEFVQGSSNIHAHVETNIVDVVPLDKNDNSQKQKEEKWREVLKQITGDFDKEDWDENHNDYIHNKVDNYDWYDQIDLKSSITNGITETNIDSK
uniref:Uncharacterized protein n=1 Tax=Moniliophthora roreri TaxID=221103 RepID=A0A0W0F1D5_MONRR